jgi:hypothetical protein
MSQCYGDLPPLQKDKTKEFKEPVIYSPMLTQTDMNISVKNKLYDFQNGVVKCKICYNDI